MHRLLIAAVLSASLWAQQQTGTLTGTVTAAGSGEPIAGAEVVINRGSQKRLTTTTDAQGRYTLQGLPPGKHDVSAIAPGPDGRLSFGSSAMRLATVQEGRELTNFDFKIVLAGRIKGRVVDQNKEPVPDITVLLVAREYTAGALRTVIAGVGMTDDQGDYTLERVRPGRAFTVLAAKRRNSLDPISDAPADPKLRLPAVVPTYYPNSTTLEGAEPITLRPAELREDINIRLTRSPSFCLEAQVDGGASPAEIRFNIGEATPTSGSVGDGAVYMAIPGGPLSPEGKLRICDLHPGDYELTAQQFSKDQFGINPFFGAMPVVMGNRDLPNLRLTASPRLPLSGEVVWDGPPPDAPVTAKLFLSVAALTRTERGSAQTTLPGEFQFKDGLLMDDYRLTLRGLPPDTYVKEMTHGERNVQLDPLRVGSAMGNRGLRIVVARDGAKLIVNTADKDAKPAPDLNIAVVPATAPNEAAVATLMITGKTDQNGAWTSTVLAPGRYYAVATSDPIDKSPEFIGKLWAARGSSKVVELRPKATESLTITPRTLE